MTRARNYATVVYPESMPDDWLVTLGKSCLEIYISPLHQFDINPTGEKKKPHYHVLICHDGVKSLEQAKEFINTFGGVGCEVVKSKRGYARYLCHLDNPEKYRYDVNDVQCMGGADYLTLIQSSSDKLYVMMEIETLCERFNIYSYSQLRRILRNYNFEWYKYVVENAIGTSSYLKSLANEKENPHKYIIDEKVFSYLEAKKNEKK